jgi:hypothetical protein
MCHNYIIGLHVPETWNCLSVRFKVIWEYKWQVSHPFVQCVAGTQ